MRCVIDNLIFCLTSHVSHSIILAQYSTSHVSHFASYIPHFLSYIPHTYVYLFRILLFLISHISISFSMSLCSIFHILYHIFDIVFNVITFYIPCLSSDVIFYIPYFISCIPCFILKNYPIAYFLHLTLHILIFHTSYPKPYHTFMSHISYHRPHFFILHLCLIFCLHPTTHILHSIFHIPVQSFHPSQLRCKEKIPIKLICGQL